MNGSMNYWVLLIVIVWISVMVGKSKGVRSIKNKMSQFVDAEVEGTKWALLVAGSNGYENYRHQANVCHAYQVLAEGGLNDENIIVMMYDDIANNPQNPYPGVIWNNPDRPDVYSGIIKDYTGDDVNANNFYGVLSGDKNAINGGSGKVLNTGPNDIIFIYMSGHGYAGLFGLPDNSLIWAKEFVDALKKKFDAKSYQKMVIYLESCNSGSMFQGLLPINISIYATTSSSANEDSFACYCPFQISPSKYTTCLGGLYSVSWLEDSDRYNRTKESLYDQYDIVRNRVSNNLVGYVSHVMEFGDLFLSNDFLVTYIGASRFEVNDNYNFNRTVSHEYSYEQFNTTTSVVTQEDAYLLHLRLKLNKARDGSKDKSKIQKELDVEIAHRKHVDHTVNLIRDILFGEETSSTKMEHVRSAGQPLVDDWHCLKLLMKIYEDRCGNLSTYGMKYSRVFANMCNVGISDKQMIAATSQACPKKNSFS